MRQPFLAQLFFLIVVLNNALDLTKFNVELQGSLPYCSVNQLTCQRLNPQFVFVNLHLIFARSFLSSLAYILFPKSLRLLYCYFKLIL
jgi:hypothetical protein